MGILDEAIREHLELKRQHGADDSELKQLEDDAFGPPQRPGGEAAPPDAAAEAATEFMSQPDLSGVDAPPADAQAAVDAPSPETSTVRREPVADVQEAPARPAGPEVADESEIDGATPGAVPEEPAAELDDGSVEEAEAEGPAEEQQPAAEHEAVTELPPQPEEPSKPQPEAPAPASHTTEERHIIADQPTQMFDVEQEFEDVPEADSAAPSDEELVEEEIAEPRLGPVEPVGAIDGGDEADLEDDEADDFFDGQRLSDELDQALEAPIEVEVEEDFEEEEPISEEQEQPAARDSDEDVLEDTPDFLEEAPEDDQLWFEQKSPKDFDFGD